ncbi:hypothetical protein EVG20_g9562 [Dentipellis fragilis]|uniref:BTB domain-containing protein n=1 Tax=Dentipellis fragilis TaxID=205917 RepID=A0A4Y9XYD5_9AGAM|nr:hypothetical protein EVG20_g9562 [Dentipellis fragilis]
MDNNAMAFEHHKELYFSDGNVALIAPSHKKHKDLSETLIVFRLHQLMLAIHSPVFKDMFTFPATPDVELYEGVPLVRMTDNASDLEAFLGVIYRQPVLSIAPLSPNTPLHVKPILVLADKYGVQYVRGPIIDQLERDWPQSLFDWDCLEAEIESRRDVFNQHQASCELDDDYPEPGSAIELARQCDIPSILPAAFYHLSRIPINYDWDNIHASWDDPPDDYWVGRSARWDRLSKEDLLCLLQGRAKLDKYLDELCSMLYPEPHTQDSTCNPDIWYAFWESVWQECRRGKDILAVLSPFSEMSGNFSKRWEKLCWSCRDKITTKASKCRKEIWDRIPEFFQLQQS